MELTIHRVTTQKGNSQDSVRTPEHQELLEQSLVFLSPSGKLQLPNHISAPDSGLGEVGPSLVKAGSKESRLEGARGRLSGQRKFESSVPEEMPMHVAA